MIEPAPDPAAVDTTATAEGDPLDARRARRAPELLRAFNAPGVLSAADVHVARCLTRLAGDDDEWVALAAALAVRAPRLGHVYVDLATIRDTVTVDTDEPFDPAALPWPPAEEWVARVSASALAAVGEDEAVGDAPLRLVGSWLYLDRYWREERRLADDLRVFGEAAAEEVDLDVLSEGLSRLFAEEGDRSQRLAAASAVLRRLAVVAGGPGTGKTTTVARIVALLCEQAAVAGSGLPLIALAAPTGKAAARLEEAVHEGTASLEVDGAVHEHLLELDASTLHRLLGWRPDSQSRFRHDRGNRLPHDVVVVDETSMVSLSLMTRLVEAVRPDARLVLVGDPGQLTSIEAGAVLGDIVGPADGGLLMRPTARERLSRVAGEDVSAGAPLADAAVGDGIVVLDRVHRFGGAIAAVAAAVRMGDGEGVVEALRGGGDEVTWIEAEVSSADSAEALAPVRARAVGTARRVIDAAAAGEAERALAELGAFRLLCAHRRGEHGVATWGARVEGWLAEEIEGFGAGGPWYVGRPLLVTENDYGLRLYNGDTGVVVATAGDRASAAFERRGSIAHFSPTRLAAVDTVYAMTVHKSQGSQFDTAAVLLPPPTSQILTRELLYTALTRARTRLLLAGTEEAIRVAVERPVARASGLGWRLWGER